MARASARVRAAPLPMTRSLVTPEGVDLGVRLADAGSRAAAFLLDAVIISVAAIVITLVIIMVAVSALVLASPAYSLSAGGVTCQLPTGTRR